MGGLAWKVLPTSCALRKSLSAATNTLSVPDVRQRVYRYGSKGDATSCSSWTARPFP